MLTAKNREIIELTGHLLAENRGFEQPKVHVLTGELGAR